MKRELQSFVQKSYVSSLYLLTYYTKEDVAVVNNWG